MKYYVIRASNNIQEIGAYPQSTLNGNELNNFNQVTPYSFPDFDPVGAIDLFDDSKKTDFIDNGAITFGYVVSPKFKGLLETCKLPPHKFYPIKVFYRGEQFEYFWFHYLGRIKEYLDTERTKLTLFDKFTFKVTQDDIPVKALGDISEYQKKIPRTEKLRLKEVVLSPGAPSYDVLDVDVLFHVVPLISESLKHKLLSNKITGLETKEFELIRFL